MCDPRKLKLIFDLGVMFDFMCMQANMKLNEEQLAKLSSPTAVREYLENQKENIENIIKQNLAIGDIYKRENLQVKLYLKMTYLQIYVDVKLMTSYQNNCIFFPYSFQLMSL